MCRRSPLDPGFALAHARASIANSAMYHFAVDFVRDPAQEAKARAGAAEALRLAPTLGEAHLAMGHYLYRVEKIMPRRSKNSLWRRQLCLTTPRPFSFWPGFIAGRIAGARRWLRLRVPKSSTPGTRFTICPRLISWCAIGRGRRGLPSRAGDSTAFQLRVEFSCLARSRSKRRSGCRQSDHPKNTAGPG